MKTYWTTTGFGFKVIASFILVLCLPSCRSRKANPVFHERNEWLEIESKLGVQIAEKGDLPFYREAVKWLEVPYKFGGNTLQGTDCSGLVMVVYERVFGKKLPRQSAKQADFANRIQKNKLVPGDLYFFDINGKGISHVGMHLVGNKFIHASIQKGVIVSDLEEAYYKRTFVGYGRCR
jgi:lipoprotein Spr